MKIEIRVLRVISEIGRRQPNPEIWAADKRQAKKKLLGSNSGNNGSQALNINKWVLKN